MIIWFPGLICDRFFRKQLSTQRNKPDLIFDIFIGFCSDIYVVWDYPHSSEHYFLNFFTDFFASIMVRFCWFTFLGIFGMDSESVYTVSHTRNLCRALSKNTQRRMKMPINSMKMVINSMRRRKKSITRWTSRLCYRAFYQARTACKVTAHAVCRWLVQVCVRCK